MRIPFEILRLLLSPRASLIAENVLLRQQLSALKRDVLRPRLRRRDRLFWVFLRRIWPGWRNSLVLVKPNTVVRWHRHGWRLFWRMKSRHRRRILYVGVTKNPKAAWLTAQIRTAFIRHEDRPRFLLRDRDGAYGRVFDAAVEALGIRTLRTTPRSPWQNAYVERVIGSIRRECLNHVIVLSQAGLRAILAEHLVYYNNGRAHQGIGGESPMPRPRRTRGRIVSKPVLGGLHHVYDRAA